jgi:hypothetical protein
MRTHCKDIGLRERKMLSLIDNGYRILKNTKVRKKSQNRRL